MEGRDQNGMDQNGMDQNGMDQNGDTRAMLSTVWRALGGEAQRADEVRFDQPGAISCHFAVADFAAALVAAAGLAAAELSGPLPGTGPAVLVHRALATGWFHTVIQPRGWQMPPFWDPLCADYLAADGWIRLHTNILSHARAVVSVLGVAPQPERVAAAVAGWKADELEAAVLAAGGAAARLRSRADWLLHPQGAAIQREALVQVSGRERRTGPGQPAVPGRPLAGIRVLDLTRGVAGPVATRCLAAFGADVLRIDPPGWEEPAVVPDVVLGKRCARLDLTRPAGRAQLQQLLAGADIVVHGYRPGALDWLALDDEYQACMPAGLIDVSLNAYGWSGPWSGRRGFDSLVQMSAGMAQEAMVSAGSERPVHLPMQALDQGTGYLMAAAAMRALSHRRRTGQGQRVRCSLARTAELLIQAPRHQGEGDLITRPALFAAGEQVDTGWGPATRLAPPIDIEGVPMDWAVPAGPLGRHQPTWPPPPH